MKLVITDDIDLRVRQKPCKNLLVRSEGDRLILTEDRRALWTLLALIGVGISVLSYRVVVFPPDDPDVALASKAFAALCGFAYALVALFVCPWNRRVVFDRTAESCQLRYRFYLLPLWFRTFCTATGDIEVTSVVHVTYSNRVPDRSMGDRAFSTMLGTAGKLMDAFETLNSRIEHHNRYLALVYQKPQSSSLPILATCRNGRAAVESLQEFCAG